MPTSMRQEITLVFLIGREYEEREWWKDGTEGFVSTNIQILCVSPIEFIV